MMVVHAVADLDFFFDPICPWAWITSRFVEEVASQRPLDIDWRFISLRMVNETRDYEREFPSGYSDVHRFGTEMLRIAAAAKAEGGSAAAGRLYGAIGKIIHVDRERERLNTAAGVADVLATAGLPVALSSAASEEDWDTAIRADTETALERAGRDVGTPILTFSPPDGPSFFGPVISRIPRGKDAVELYDTIVSLANTSGFFELKRSIRESPQTS